MTKKMLKICFIFLILFFLLIQIYPVIWVFIASLKSSVELSINAFSLPKEITFENFVQVVNDGKILGYMWNSLKITAVSLVLIVGLSGTVGFSISKFRAKYNQKIYSFFTFGIMVPVQITLIPLFIFYSKVGILNTSFALVLPQVGFALPLSVMMFVNFYRFIPNELIEAGIMDGASTYRVFGQIMFPLARNTIITIMSMYSILIWNDFIFANTFISESAAKTVTMGLKDYVGAFGNVNWGATYAAIAISILPPMIIYFSLNKWVTAGMTAGATKG
ncbi:MAG: carbohydrate ABC transporter permease [Streptococcaceae bacterium]|jgi:raffinose/stachyose/melibiose transport system permease protein|nr:carbohydrate ABC transporter permease [Streptococcaceae bacterium]MCH4176272.1 carbohydrate ABC transporter permease [Streptococcaceae bacterium]